MLKNINRLFTHIHFCNTRQVETSDHFEAGESSQLRQLAKRIQHVPRKPQNKDKIQ